MAASNLIQLNNAVHTNSYSKEIRIKIKKTHKIRLLFRQKKTESLQEINKLI